jgi:hypothetical protein
MKIGHMIIAKCVCQLTVVTETCTAEVSERLSVSLHKLLQKLGTINGNVIQQLLQSSEVIATISILTAVIQQFYHRAVKNDIITVSNCLQT